MKLTLSLALFASLLSAYALRPAGPAAAPSAIHETSSKDKDPGPPASRPPSSTQATPSPQTPQAPGLSQPPSPAASIARAWLKYLVHALDERHFRQHFRRLISP